MNNEIFIKENFKVDDTHSKVRGFVFAYDENDNLVFAKENMIVKTGRQYIMKNGLNENSFKCAFLSTNGDMVTAEDTLTTVISRVETNPGISFSTDILNALRTDTNFDNISINNNDYYAGNERTILEGDGNKEVKYNNNIFKLLSGNTLRREISLLNGMEVWNYTEFTFDGESFNLPNNIKNIKVLYTSGGIETEWIWNGEKLINGEVDITPTDNTKIKYLIKYIYNLEDEVFKNDIISRELPNNSEVIYNNEDWKVSADKLIQEIIPTSSTIIEYNNMFYKFYKDNPATEDEEIDYNKFLSVALTPEDYFSYYVDYENLVIRCLIVFNSTETIEANSLGLLYNNFETTNDTEKDEEKIYYVFDVDNQTFNEFSGESFEEDVTYFENNPGLFSRVTFPTYYKSATQRLTFKYYIYF